MLLLTWFIMFFVAVPALTFSVKPDAPRWKRCIRLPLAWSIAYPLNAYALSKIYFPTIAGRSIEPNAPYALIGHWTLMGWLWVFAYIFIYELLWRKKHYRIIQSTYSGVGDDWISNFFFRIGFIAMAILLLLAIWGLFMSIQEEHYS